MLFQNQYSALSNLKIVILESDKNQRHVCVDYIDKSPQLDDMW